MLSPLFRDLNKRGEYLLELLGKTWLCVLWLSSPVNILPSLAFQHDLMGFFFPPSLILPDGLTGIELFSEQRRRSPNMVSSGLPDTQSLQLNLSSTQREAAGRTWVSTAPRGESN